MYKHRGPAVSKHNIDGECTSTGMLMGFAYIGLGLEFKEDDLTKN